MMIMRKLTDDDALHDVFRLMVALLACMLMMMRESARHPQNNTIDASIVFVPITGMRMPIYTP